jgi:hypothetical protein
MTLRRAKERNMGARGRPDHLAQNGTKKRREKPIMLKGHCFPLTPDRLILSLLLAEVLLFLSNWLAWPAWHKGYAVLTCVAMVGVTLC